uniref:DNA binding protein n=1 Tax=Solanum tuberosum TaxID=4113 RepID=M1B0R5_SOLTU
MISTKKLIKMARRWQKFAAMQRKRISPTRNGSDADSCSTSSSSIIGIAFVDYIVSLIKKGVAAGDLHNALLLSIPSCFRLDLDSELKYEGGSDNWIVNCRGGALDDDGERMASCDICEIWKHTHCCLCHHYLCVGLAALHLHHQEHRAAWSLVIMGLQHYCVILPYV